MRGESGCMRRGSWLEPYGGWPARVPVGRSRQEAGGRCPRTGHFGSITYDMVGIAGCSTQVPRPSQTAVNVQPALSRCAGNLAVRCFGA